MHGPASSPWSDVIQEQFPGSYSATDDGDWSSYRGQAVVVLEIDHCCGSVIQTLQSIYNRHNHTLPCGNKKPKQNAIQVLVLIENPIMPLLWLHSHGATTLEHRFLPVTLHDVAFRASTQAPTVHQI